MLNFSYGNFLIPIGMSFIISLMSALYSPAEAASVRVKDICTFQNEQEEDLIGYGLVIGLDGSGDGNNTRFTIQSLANMMERLGVTIDAKRVKVKNVAAVMVTAKLSSNQPKGSHIDVTVSSLGDASSLQGGTLLLTPLANSKGTVRATAQGPVSIGGFNVQVDEGNRIFNNYTLVGRIPNGARITRAVEKGRSANKEIILSLHNPDNTTAHRIAQKINIKYGLTAVATDGGTVKVYVPDSLAYQQTRMKFISDIGQLRIVPDHVARVVINEKTGTIVAGQHVTIEPVIIAHGTITVDIQSTPIISQPAPYSLGQTVQTSESRISIQDESIRVVHLERSVSLADIAKALNRIGATPRDVIAIFQALKQAGALRAELVIL
ncbi:MAG: flagellar basal body P-ring protein FlgI [candidate division Zixibacteria bacterium]|nr:flagellar basal body P-ring protein FlgI [candidate division Zixibacteria bacterium]